MKIIGIRKLPAEFLRQQLADGRLTGADYPHYDHNHQ